MSSRSRATTVLTGNERDRAEAIGVSTYIRSARYRLLKEKYYFAALGEAVDAMERLKFPNPYDGRVLGAMAQVILANDPKALGYMRKRRIAALDDNRDELFGLTGLKIAEDFLLQHKDEILSEPRLTNADVLLREAETLFEAMQATGNAMAEEVVSTNELAVTFEDGDPSNVARMLLSDAVAAYESMVPETENDGIPDAVERHSIARAAFMRLAVDDLVELGVNEGFQDMPNKESIARALTQRYGDDLDKVAELVVRQTEGNPEYGLVTRLIPLALPPDLDSVEAAFLSLKNRYLETRPATFYIFGEVSRHGDVLRINGRVRSFAVNAAEAGGEARVNARPRQQEIQIVLRGGEMWAEANVRRTGDLNVVRSVLTRTGELLPAESPTPPDPLVAEPYGRWDARTVWMLDFMRRDLQATDLKLRDTPMANFVSRDIPVVGPGGERRPNVQAVRLLGEMLHDHPEACGRIASGAQLRDVEVTVFWRKDLQDELGTLVRCRLSWEEDHLAIYTGADAGDFDAELHRRLVTLVRSASTRALDEEGLQLTLRRILLRATEGLGDGEPGVFDDEQDEA